MAITAIEYFLFRTMRDQNALPLGSDILELGEANWYGDVPLDLLAADIARYARPDEAAALLERLTTAAKSTETFRIWDIAKVFYATFFHNAAPTAIDFHGTPAALQLDLNGPVDLGRRFGVIFNLGTAEHVFNIAQVFKTVHDHTAPGGMMIHGLPLGGWLDHGFYNVNPTLYWDIAAANGYKILVLLYAQLTPFKTVQIADREQLHAMTKRGEMGADSLVYAVFARPEEEREFCIPMQGYYAGAISDEARSAWHTLRT